MQVAANQQVVYLQPQQMYPGGQGGVVVIQPSGAVTTVPHGYAMPGQQAMYVPQQVSCPFNPFISILYASSFFLKVKLVNLKTIEESPLD